MQLTQAPFICLIRGCSGVGKTSISRLLAKLYFPSIHIVVDELHNWITGHHICHEHIKLSVQSAGAVACVSSLANQSVFIDSVFVDPWEIDLLLSEFNREKDVPIYLVTLTADLGVLQARDGGRMPEDIMGARVAELYSELKQSGETRGGTIDTTHLTLAEVVDKIREAINTESITFRFFR